MKLVCTARERTAKSTMVVVLMATMTMEMQRAIENDAHSDDVTDATSHRHAKMLRCRCAWT